MNTRLLILTIFSLVVVITICRFVLVPSQDAQMNQSPISGKQFSQGWVHDRDHNFTAKQNNNSKRQSLNASQVPLQAQRLAQDYKTIIYPALQQAIIKDHLLPASLNALPNLKKYLSLHPVWSTPQSYRVDGTMISKPLYATNPSGAQHDPWICSVIDQPGKPTLLVEGWDDGKVTYNFFSDNYTAKVHTSIGDISVSAPPGAIGIPEGTKQVKDLYTGL